MSGAHPPKMSWVMVSHTLLTLGIAVWFGWWGFVHHPAREWRAKVQAQEAAAARAAKERPPSKHKQKSDPTKIQIFNGGQTGMFQSAFQTFGLAWADAAFGICVIGLFYVGSGTYFKMLENWIKARSSGDVQAIRGRGLQDQALHENVGRGGGIQ